MLRKCTLLPLLLAVATGCGARTEPWVDHGDRSSGRTDASVEQCAPIFEDCDGSAADCAEAFRRGCACGDPPAYLVAGPEVTFRATRTYRVRWTGDHLVVPINERERPSVEVFDVTGRRRLHSIPGYLRAVDRTTLYIGDDDPYGEAWMQAFDAGTGEPVGSRRQVPLHGLIPLAGGDLAGQRMTERWIVPGREHHVYAGLVRAESPGVTWTAVLPGIEWDTWTEPSWNGTHVLSVHGADRIFLYDPYANEIAGPIRYRAPDRETYSVDDPDPVLATEHGWLAIWTEMDLDLRNGELVTVPLNPDGTPAGGTRRWRDTEARMTDGVGRWAAQGLNGEIAVLYTRTIADRVERVMLRLDDTGRGVGPFGPPRQVDAWDFNGVRGLLWAGYSYVVADRAFGEGGEYVGLRLQRVCPRSL